MTITDAEIDALKAGDRIYRFAWSGGETAAIVEGEVIRVNRLTVTVRNGFGDAVRWPRQDVQGRADWESFKHLTRANG